MLVVGLTWQRLNSSTSCGPHNSVQNNKIHLELLSYLAVINGVVVVVKLG